MTRQLPLEIRLRDSATFANFVPGDNTQAVNSLRACTGVNGEPYIYLWGGPGTGKTHLLQSLCHQLAAAGRRAFYLPLAQHHELDTELLKGLEDMAAVCIDDVHAVTQSREWEQGLFHLYNRVRDNAAHLVITGNNSPAALGFKLDDLTSRISNGLVFRLTALHDEQKVESLQVRARGRGFDLPADVAGYLLRHSRRDMTALFELLDRLDEASLLAQRKLTIPFVRNIL